MNGDRDLANVSKSTNLRTSPSAYRKCAKGCCSSNLSVSKGSHFSSSVPKGQSTHTGRRGTRSSISETLLLSADSEKKRVVGGKTPTKQSAVLTSSTPDIVAPDGAKDDQLDALLKPKTPEEDMEKSKVCSLSDDGLHEHATDSLRQPTCSEKVSKWLEDSQHSTMTDLTDNHSISPDEDLEVNKREEEDEVIGRDISNKETLVSETEAFDDRNRPADNVPESIPTLQTVVKVPVDKFKGFNGLSLARRIIIGYLKVLMCLSVLYLGFLLRIRPTSWDNYQPPPT
ncbi:unnamed protein product [Calypogeia fissa]